MDRALVKIQGKFNEIHIEIVNGDCQLVKPMNSYISSEMKGKMSPSLFLKVCIEWTWIAFSPLIENNSF